MADEPTTRKRMRGPSVTTIMKQAARAGYNVASATIKDGSVELVFAGGALTPNETAEDVKKLI